MSLSLRLLLASFQIKSLQVLNIFFLADVLLAAAGAAVGAGGGVGAGGREAAVLRQPRGRLPALAVHGFGGGAGQRDGA